jgi:hypothetical protein
MWHVRVVSVTVVTRTGILSTIRRAWFIASGQEEVWGIHGGKRGGDGSSRLAGPVKREDQKDGIAAAMAPVETGDGRKFSGG